MDTANEPDQTRWGRPEVALRSDSGSPKAAKAPRGCRCGTGLQVLAGVDAVLCREQMLHAAAAEQPHKRARTAGGGGAATLPLRPFNAATKTSLFVTLSEMIGSLHAVRADGAQAADSVGYGLRPIADNGGAPLLPSSSAHAAAAGGGGGARAGPAHPQEVPLAFTLLLLSRLLVQAWIDANPSEPSVAELALLRVIASAIFSAVAVVAREWAGPAARCALEASLYNALVADVEKHVLPRFPIAAANDARASTVEAVDDLNAATFALLARFITQHIDFGAERVALWCERVVPYATEELQRLSEPSGGAKAQTKVQETTAHALAAMLLPLAALLEADAIPPTAQYASRYRPESLSSADR